MKCPKCGYISFDYLDTCKRCGRELTQEKSLLGIRFSLPEKKDNSHIPREEFMPSRKLEPKKVIEESPVEQINEITHKEELQVLKGDETYADNSFLEDATFPLVDEVEFAPKSGFLRRVFSFIIDIIFICIVSLLFFFGGIALINPEALFTIKYIVPQVLTLMTVPFLLLIFVLTLIYFTYFHASSGQTLGKMLFRIKVIQVNGEPLSFDLAFLRVIGYIVSGLILGFGFLWIILDKNKQAWHDKLAGTYVIKV